MGHGGGVGGWLDRALIVCWVGWLRWTKRWLTLNEDEMPGLPWYIIDEGVQGLSEC